MAWFRRKRNITEETLPSDRKVRTEGLFVKCPACGTTLFKKDLEASLYVCTNCRHHMKWPTRLRLAHLFDEGRYETFDDNIVSTDILGFFDTKSYAERIEQARKSTGFNDAIVCAEGMLGGRPIIGCVMVMEFIGGSMGSVVGEKVTRAIERAIARKKPLIIVSASGGARMMEGTYSLMQLAKICGALARLDAARVPYISVLTDPTTGGVTASFAMLGDINVAEPGALIGFAGPRVIEQTIRQKLPPGFQQAEFLLTHGMLDAVVDRREMRKFLMDALAFMAG